MGKNCMVLFCRNRGDIEGLHYFCLTSKRYRSWMTAIGRDPTREILHASNRICSDHFSEDSFYYKKGKQCLKPLATPTIRLGLKKPLMVSNTQEPSSSSSAEILSISQNNDVDEELFYNTEEVIDIHDESENDDLILNKELESRKRKSTDFSSSTDNEEFQGPLKKTSINYNDYSVDPKKLAMHLEQAKKHKQQVLNRLKYTKERINRLSRKVTQLKQVVLDLQNKN
ncbi:unnamed protein product [Phaedon cochleariae]|uniref:THAP-type domain-containing protein n=1 Tax=Phaedon cochleariae TaxID=80249 RepID=A0A9N9X570_PHACE|nr:unnamed protein product [Phaedon cochleariae]